MKIKNKDFLYLISAIIAFGSFIFGYSLVCISMMADKIQLEHNLSGREFDWQLSFITTLMPLGAFIENKTMMLMDVFGICCISLQAWQIQFQTIYIGRFLLGLYIGISSGVIPVYLVSISPPEVSGIIGSFNQLLITIGIAAAYGLGMLNISWQKYMIIPALFCLIRLISLFVFRFDRLQRHFNNGDRQALKKYISYFYQSGTVQQLSQLRGFKSNHEVKSTYRTEEKGLLWNLFAKFTSNASPKIIKIALVIAVANQFSGINAILFYAKQIFEQITSSNKQLAAKYTFYLGILQVIITFISGFFINKFGRRTLMLVGQSLIVVSLICAFFFQTLLQNSQTFITIAVFVHIVGFSISLGPVGMLYAAQLMENLTLVVCVVWIFTLFVSTASQMMISTFGIGKVFLFYGLISLYCLIYFYWNMIESKGLSRQQLLAKYESNIKFESLEESESIQLNEKEPIAEEDKGTFDTSPNQ